MSLHEAFSQLKFDKRMTNWNLNQGIVTKDEIKKNTEQLEDVSDNTESMVLFSDPSSTKSVEQDESQIQEPSAQQELKSSKEDHLQDVTNMQGPDRPNQDLASYDNTDNTLEETSADTNNASTAATNKTMAMHEVKQTDEDSSDPWW